MSVVQTDIKIISFFFNFTKTLLTSQARCSFMVFRIFGFIRSIEKHCETAAIVFSGYRYFFTASISSLGVKEALMR